MIFVICVYGLMVVYSNGYVVLCEVLFEVLVGLIVVLVGVNGVGKFIFFKVLMGFVLVLLGVV